MEVDAPPTVMILPLDLTRHAEEQDWFDGQSCPRISMTNHDGMMVIPRLIEVKIYSFVLGHREPYKGMGVGLSGQNPQ